MFSLIYFYVYTFGTENMLLLADEKRKEIGCVVFYAVLVFKKLWLKTHHTQYLLINAELSQYNYAKYSKPILGVFNFGCNFVTLVKKYQIEKLLVLPMFASFVSCQNLRFFMFYPKGINVLQGRKQVYPREEKVKARLPFPREDFSFPRSDSCQTERSEV